MITRPEHPVADEPIKSAAPGQADRILAPALRLAVFTLSHTVLFIFSLWAAYALRFDLVVPVDHLQAFRLCLPWFLLVKLTVFFSLRQFHGSWRYVTFADLASLLYAATLSLLIIVALTHFVFPASFPRSVLLLDYLLTVTILGGLRASWRLVREQYWPRLFGPEYRAALLVGADHRTALLASQIHAHPELGYRIRGFLAINGEPIGVRFGDIPVVGRVDEAASIAERYCAKEILVTSGVLPGHRLRQLMEICRRAGVGLKIMPPPEDRFSGTATIPLRDIEIEDLLRREPVVLDSTAVRQLIAGRTVMVTGAGGSIGSEICRQVIRFHPHTLILLGRGENRIFALENELRASGQPCVLTSCIGDVTDRQRMRQLFEMYRPEIVFHAAAHKHVPLMERNVGEAVKNNVFGTKCVADLADEMGVASFVLISTDKAVKPTSVMGATKQLAERYVHGMSQKSKTRFVVVRFGNVLGSTGSVLPIFQQQIRHGGPITITDPRMVRFFMSIPEASQLVLQAAAMGKGGEIFVLDMGEQIRIVDLAQDLIRLSGLPEEAIEIVFTGTRPGEKLYEELYLDDEETISTAHPQLLAAYHRPFCEEELQQTLEKLKSLLNGPDDVLRAQLVQHVSDFQTAPALPPGSDAPAGKREASLSARQVEAE